jgi:hypothetical protein
MMQREAEGCLLTVQGEQHLWVEHRQELPQDDDHLNHVTASMSIRQDKKEHACSYSFCAMWILPMLYRAT